MIYFETSPVVKPKEGNRSLQGVLRRIGLPVLKAPVTSTGLTALEECKAKFFFQERMGLVPKGISDNALTRGELIHAAIRQIIVDGNVENVAKVVSDCVQAWIKQAIADNAVLAEGTVEALDALKDVAVAVAIAFHDEAKARDWLTKGKVLAVEMPVTVGVLDRVDSKRANSVLAGTFDLVTIEDGKLVIYDWKTTTDDPVDVASLFPLDPQWRIYKLLAESKWPSFPVKMIRHFVIKVPTIRRKMVGTGAARHRETLPEYVERVKQWYVEKRAEDANRPPFALSEIRDFNNDPWVKDFLWRVREGLRWAKRETWKTWPKTGARRACRSNGMECPYLTLCLMEQKDWPAAMLAYYRRRTRYELQEGSGNAANNYGVCDSNKAISPIPAPPDDEGGRERVTEPVPAGDPA